MLLTPRTFHRAGGFASWLHLCCCCGVTPCPDDLQVTFTDVDSGLCTGCLTDSPTLSFEFQSINVDGTYVVPKVSETASQCTYTLTYPSSGILLTYDYYGAASCAGGATSDSVQWAITIVVSKVTNRITQLSTSRSGFPTHIFVLPFLASGLSACLGDVISNQNAACGSSAFLPVSGGTAVVEAAP